MRDGVEQRHTTGSPPPTRQVAATTGAESTQLRLYSSQAQVSRTTQLTDRMVKNRCLLLNTIEVLWLLVTQRYDKNNDIVNDYFFVCVVFF